MPGPAVPFPVSTWKNHGGHPRKTLAQVEWIPKFPENRRDSPQRSCREQLIPPGMLPPPPDERESLESGAGSSPFPVLSVSRDKPGISLAKCSPCLLSHYPSPPGSRGAPRESNHSIPEAFSLSSGQTRPSQPTPGFLLFAGVQYLWSLLGKHRGMAGLAQRKALEKGGGGKGFPHPSPQDWSWKRQIQWKPFSLELTP